MDVFRHIGTRRRRLTGTVVVLATLASLVGVVPAARADDDDFDVDCGDITELIFAIADANVNDEEDVINLEEDCEYVLTEPYMGTDNGLPEISEPFELTINGNGATIERDEDATEDFRILEVEDTGILVLNDLSIEGGRLEGDPASPLGGGIANSGDLTGENLEVRENSAIVLGFGLTGRSIAGGGIFNDGTLMLEESSVSGNSGIVECHDNFCSGNQISGNQSIGGGIYNSGTLTLEDSSVSGNSAIVACDIGNCEEQSGGGGIFNIGVATLEASSVSRNRVIVTCDGGGCSSSSFGGGIDNAGGILTLEASRVNKNLASVAGGEGSINNALGGGINSEEGVLTVESSRVDRNRVRSINGRFNGPSGGGIASSGGMSFVRETRLRGNRVSALESGDLSSIAEGGGYFGHGGTHTLDANLVRANMVLAPEGSASGGGYAFVSSDAFTDAMVTVTDNLIIDNVANAPGGTAQGGGIYADGGGGSTVTVTVTDSEITENEASGGEAEGGGIWLDPSDTTVDVFDTEVDDNEPQDCFPAGAVGGDGC